MNLNALRMRLLEITDKIIDGRCVDAIALTFDIVDDINAEQNPQPTLAFRSVAKNRIDESCGEPGLNGWTDNGTGDNK